MSEPGASAFDLFQANQDLLVKNRYLESEVARLLQLVQFKDEQLRLAYLQKYGPKSEKLSDAQLELLEKEPSVSAGEVDQEAARPAQEKQIPKPRKPATNQTGRLPLPAHLERREKIVPCAPEDCHCGQCGKERPVIGYETREQLACRPAEYWVEVIRREKRGSCCLEEQGVATAAVPDQILPKSKLSDEFIIQVLAAKFQQFQPVYRQCAVLWEDHGIELSRQTVTQAILAAGDLLRPIVGAQAAELRATGYLQADETRLPCQSSEQKGQHHTAWIWEFSSPAGPVVFEFEMGRGREDGPKKFAQGFRGKWQSDGYAVYDKIGEGIIHVACMAHIRRHFNDVSKLAPLDPLPVELLQKIGELYKIEEEARSQGLSAAARLALRQSKSQPLMQALKERMVQIRQGLNPGARLAKACNYALGQWTRMEEYLKDGRLEIDNNWCEGAMRPVALGRKNWLHVGSELAGPKIAAIMSIVETCRRLNIQLRPYLRDVLPKLPNWPINRVAELTPTAWKAAQKA